MSENTNAVATIDHAKFSEIQEKVLAEGDLSKLTPEQRVNYYLLVCNSLGLNPATRPFGYLTLGAGKDKKLVMYAYKDCTDQLRRIYKVSTSIIRQEERNGIYIVTVRASTSDGRCD